MNFDVLPINELLRGPRNWDAGTHGGHHDEIAILASLAMGRLIESQLLGVSARDPWVISGATVALALVALLAGLLPALRATRVDPAIALRSE